MSGRGAKRFPSRTPEDVEILNALPAESAAAFDRLLLVQHRSELRFRQQVVEADLEPGALERLLGRRASAWSHGAGGGRRRGIPAVSDG